MGLSERQGQEGVSRSRRNCESSKRSGSHDCVSLASCPADCDCTDRQRSKHRTTPVIIAFGGSPPDERRDSEVIGCERLALAPHPWPIAEGVGRTLAKSLRDELKDQRDLSADAWIYPTLLRCYPDHPHPSDVNSCTSATPRTIGTRTARPIKAYR